MEPFARGLRATLTTHLRRFERRALPQDGNRTAAVAVVVVPGDDGRPAVLITRRALGLRRHSGQWALPGGRLDAGETVEDAALRELDEEVSLKLPPGAVLGLLDDFVTRSGFLITPVVLWGRDAELQPDPTEVASVHRIPFAELAAPENLLIHSREESDRPLLAMALLGTTIYSPTAAILHQFFEVAVAGRDTRVAHYEQPRFAWR